MSIRKCSRQRPDKINLPSVCFRRTPTRRHRQLRNSAAMTLMASRLLAGKQGKQVLSATGETAHIHGHVVAKGGDGDFCFPGTRSAPASR